MSGGVGLFRNRQSRPLGPRSSERPTTIGYTLAAIITWDNSQKELYLQDTQNGYKLSYPLFTQV